MSRNDDYQLQEQEDSEDLRKRRRRYQWDTGINWVFIVLLTLFGVQLLEYDVFTYHSEKMFFQRLNDGVLIEEAEDPYMKAGMERNLKYKGKSNSAFFFAKWSRRAPIYLGAIVLPLVVALARVFRRKNKRGLDKFYYPLGGLAIIYVIYFFGRVYHYW
jgi:hypothetical protein